MKLKIHFTTLTHTHTHADTHSRTVDGCGRKCEPMPSPGHVACYLVAAALILATCCAPTVLVVPVVAIKRGNLYLRADPRTRGHCAKRRHFGEGANMAAI